MGNQIPGRIHRTRDCENSCKARLPRPLLSERGLLASSHFHVFIIVSLSHSAKLRHPTGAVCVENWTRESARATSLPTRSQVGVFYAGLQVSHALVSNMRVVCKSFRKESVLNKSKQARYAKP